MMDQWGYFSSDKMPEQAKDWERFWRNRISAEIISRFLDDAQPETLSDFLIENIAVFVHRGNEDYP
jgi:hypothetical protein